MRILFVDDEPSILDGLRRMLRPFRKEWDMLFAESGAAALELAQSQPIDVVVTDMRMPGMSGAQLLTRFHELHPEAVRFVLSGHSELESVMRAVPVAHQFLTKPCEAEVLKDAVVRACELRKTLASGDIERVIGGVDALPSRPELYSAIVEALADSEVEIGSITTLLESDIAISAKLLQLVNSAFFGLPQEVTSVSRAIALLGLERLRDLVLSIEVFRPSPGASVDLDAFLAELQTRSLQTANLAARMFERGKQSSLAFTAGMLHDVGELVLGTQLSDGYSEVLERARAEGRPRHEIELERLGLSHAEVGAYLLGLWGLPYPVIEAAAYHHRPTALPQQGFGELAAVHVASALVSAHSPLEDQGSAEQIDLEYLERLGVRDRLEEWEMLAEETLADAEEG